MCLTSCLIFIILANHRTGFVEVSLTLSREIAHRKEFPPKSMLSLFSLKLKVHDRHPPPLFTSTKVLLETYRGEAHVFF